MKTILAFSTKDGLLSCYGHFNIESMVQDLFKKKSFGDCQLLAHDNYYYPQVSVKHLFHKQKAKVGFLYFDVMNF